MGTANRHLRDKKERKKGMKKRTKVSFGRTMIKPPELLRLAKSTSPDEVTLNSEEIKPVASSYACLNASVRE